MTSPKFSWRCNKHFIMVLGCFVFAPRGPEMDLEFNPPRLWPSVWVNHLPPITKLASSASSATVSSDSSVSPNASLIFSSHCSPAFLLFFAKWFCLFCFQLCSLRTFTCRALEASHDSSPNSLGIPGLLLSFRPDDPDSLVAHTRTGRWDDEYGTLHSQQPHSNPWYLSQTPGEVLESIPSFVLGWQLVTLRT